MSATTDDLVSVILINFRGIDDTLGAIQALRDGDWPLERLEIVVVDNASGDGSAERLRDVEGIVLVESNENLGFAGGCNLGVRSATGSIIALLNNDARPAAGWISAAVAAFEEDPAIMGVASKVLDESGTLVDFIDAGLTWFGKGYKPFVTEVAGTLGDRPKDVLFGTGSAMFIRRSAFEALEGFDERYFMFYEDVDLGWRLNLRGWRFRYVPESVALHRHHGTVARFGSYRETYLLERNALFTLYKNVDDDRLHEILPAALALTVRRGVAAGELDSASFDFRASIGADAQDDLQVSKEALASMFAVDQFVEQLPGLAESRRVIQASRAISDRALWSLFGRVDAVSPVDDSYGRGYDAIVSAFDVTSRPSERNVLIVTGDPIGRKMAGPAIRAWNMAAALATEHNVTLVTMSNLEELEAPFTLRRVRAGDDRAFAPLERAADVIIFQGHAMQAFPAIATGDSIVVADVYDPMHLEQLEQGRELGMATWRLQVESATDSLNEQLERADFVLCASERQRMFYLGQLAALGRVNPANYLLDSDLSGLLAVVPFGLDATPPVHERDVLKGVHDGIGAEDRVLLWGGGVYSWFDPKSVVRAVAALAQRRPELKLFFQGTKHPHPGVPEMAIVAEVRELAAELGVLDRSVFLNDSWVDFAERQNYLTEADAGVSTHFAHVETTFSFRTRILDYLWAGLPMVVTAGDSFADLVESENLGIVVAPDSVDDLVAAIETVVFDEPFRAEAMANIARVRERFVWSNTLAPLTAFVRSPRRAPDREDAALAAGGRPVAKRRTTPSRGWRRNASLVVHYLRNGGPRVVMRKVLDRLRSR